MRTEMRKKAKGSVAVITAITMVALLGLGAMAIDIGNLMVARSELQNAADAAAMAGAGCLYRRTECANTTATEPDWTDAEALASGFATSTSTTPAPPSPSNLVQGAAVKVVSTASGYWNITGTPAGLQTGITPGTNDMPAVQVNVVKDSANANGGVPVFLGRVLGVQILKASAVATAVVSRPGYVGPGGLFPIAIPQCMYTNYWNSATNSPQTYQTGNPPIPGQTETQTVGQPYVFDIMSTYHTDKCTFSAQWTSFNDQSAQSAKTSKDLINNGNTTGLSIGDSTFIQSGTMDTLFQLTQACSDVPNGNGNCAYVTVPVVDTVANPGQNQTIQAFACLHIINEVGNGSNAHVIVQMVAAGMNIKNAAGNMVPTQCETPSSGGVGPNYGSITPPRLVQ